MFVYQRVGEGIATYCRISLFLSFPRWVCYQGGHLLQREMFTRRQGLAWEMDGFFPDHPIWSSHTSIWFILWCGSSTDPSFRSVILGTRWTFIIWHHGISWVGGPKPQWQFWGKPHKNHLSKKTKSTNSSNRESGRWIQRFSNPAKSINRHQSLGEFGVSGLILKGLIIYVSINVNQGIPLGVEYPPLINHG